VILFNQVIQIAAIQSVIKIQQSEHPCLFIPNTRSPLLG
jgi:hypothetical protein